MYKYITDQPQLQTKKPAKTNTYKIQYATPTKHNFQHTITRKNIHLKHNYHLQLYICEGKTNRKNHSYTYIYVLSRERRKPSIHIERSCNKMCLKYIIYKLKSRSGFINTFRENTWKSNVEVVFF